MTGIRMVTSNCLNMVVLLFKKNAQIIRLKVTNNLSKYNYNASKLVLRKHVCSIGCSDEEANKTQGDSRPSNLFLFDRWNYANDKRQ